MMNNDNILKKAIESSKFIRELSGFKPKIAIILGSGLGEFSNNVQDKIEIDYKDIPNFPVSTVEGHTGKLIVGKIYDKEVILMNGRFHYYEGYSMAESTFPIRVFALLGVEKLIVTNAAGGINQTFNTSDLMIIKDHIKLVAESPLIGKNISEFGPRFPDMTNAYSKKLISLAKETSKELNIDIKEGVYAFMAGPQYETPAEINALKILGADAVGMSTVPEVIVANHCNIEVLGISCITNIIGKQQSQLTHEEVIKNADIASNNFSRLLLETLRKIQFSNTI